MLGVALRATIPVFVGVVLASMFGSARGVHALWATVVVVTALASAVWGLETTGAPFAQRFLAPLAVYAPPLLLGGMLLAILGRTRWRMPYVLPIAIGLALANLFLAQYFFVAGCAAGFWECP